MTIWNGLTSDGAVVPIQVDDQGRVVAVGSGPDSPLVVDGDYLRPRDPDLGLGTANINLDADGSATFAGNTQLTKPRSTSAGNNTGGLTINPSDSTAYWNFRVDISDNGLHFDTTSGGDKIIFGLDGSASFADTLTSGPIDLSAVDTAGCVMRPDGLLRLQREANKGGSAVMQVYNGTTVTTTLNANGSATFMGAIKAIQDPDDDSVQSIVNSNGTAFFTGGVYIGNPITNNRMFSTNPAGANGTETIWIGNSSIQVSSDARLKENIKDTELDALAAIQQIKVKDFTWNDPNDTSYNNRNARGVWTGVIAQEIVDVLPFVVNAPRKEEDLSIDYESENTWILDQSQLCPVLIKALQQAVTRIEALEAEVQQLKGGN